MSAALRGALIGYGFIGGRGHLPAYLARTKSRGDVAIVAIADACEARRELAKKAHPEARIYADHVALLAAEAKNLDFVDIATPPSTHAEIAHAAFDVGLHVLCEKPITLTVAEAESVLAHAKRASRVFFPCHNYKHAPVIQAVKQCLASGRIGALRSVTLQTYRNTHAKGVTEWKRDWRRERGFAGGGIAMDHGSHTFYLAFDWFAQDPVAVTAKMSILDRGPEGKWDVEDNFSCAVTFPSGIANATLTWNAGVRKVIYTLHGEHGAIMVHNDEIEVTQMIPIEGEDVGSGAVKFSTEKLVIESKWMDASHVTWFDALFDQFAEAVAKSDFVGAEARTAYQCIQLIETAYASARESSRELPLHAYAG